MTIVELDDHRPCPHIVVRAPGRVHVLPRSLVEDLTAGRLSPADLEDPRLLPDIVA